MARQSAQHIPQLGNWNTNEESGFTMVFETVHMESGTAKAVSGNGVQPFEIEQRDDPMKVRQSIEEEGYGKAAEHRGTAQRTREVSDGKQRFQEPADVRVARKLGNDAYKVGAESPNHHAYQGRLGNRPASSYPERKSFAEGGVTGMTAPGTPGRSRLRTSVDNLDRGTALPKFGDWNETGATAGESYTMIFNQARTEKKGGGPAWVPHSDSSAAGKHSQETKKTNSNGQCCTIL